MKEAVYSFSNSAGDKFYLRLAADSEMFLSKELTSFLKDKDFLFHVDDDDIELDFIKSDTNVIPIYLWHNKHWVRDCENVINKF